MAKTLIGQLILRLRAEGMGEATKVVSTMKDIERAAREMGRTGVGSWGTSFQKQLTGLHATSADIEEVRKSWVRLHESMSSRDLAKAVKRAEVSHWKTNTLAELGQQRANLDRHFKALESRATSHSMRMRDIMKAGFVAMGFYTLPYGAGMAAREGLTASSERRREIFRQDMAGIPDGQQQTLFDASEAAGQKYPSVPITAVMELSRSAFSVMGDAERAAAVLDQMVASLVVLQSSRGPDAAGNHLTSLIRGLDNIGANKDGQIGIDQVNDMIAAATRAAQVDPDFDLSQFFEFARQTKTAGPGLSMDFLARAPVYMQDMGSGATGNALAMGFKAFVLEAVGSAGGKKYLAERDRIGVRQGGKLVDSDLFGTDPDQWVLKYLVPALKKDGVDLNNDTQVAAAVGKLSGNTTATGFMTRIITQQEQVSRWLELMDKAMGPDAAKDVRFEDPFVGLEAFKKSMENLSAAMLPIDTINAGLNGLADGVNALAKIAKDNPGLTAAALGGTGVGAAVGGKYAFDKLSDLFGLKSSAIALDGSAAALTRAAVALGGSGVADGVADAAGGGKLPKGAGLGTLGLLARGGPIAAAVAAALGASYEFVAQTSADNARENKDGPYKDYSDGYSAEENAARNYKQFHGVQFEGGWHRVGLGAAPAPGLPDAYRDVLQLLKELEARKGASLPDSGPIPPAKPDIDFGNTLSEAQQIGTEIIAALSVSAKPNIDLASLMAARDLARQTLALINQIGTAAQAAQASADRQMRRNMADYGVAP